VDNEKEFNDFLTKKYKLIIDFSNESEHEFKTMENLLFKKQKNEIKSNLLRTN